MPLKSLAPRALSRRLRGFTLTASAITALTVVLAVLWLALDYDRRAQQDARRMLAGGLSALVDTNDAITRDYAHWGAAYEAARDADLDWLDENIGSGAYSTGSMDAVVLVGGSLPGVLGWTAEGSTHLGQAEFETMAGTAIEMIARKGVAPDTRAVSTFAFIAGEPWVLSADWVVPHDGRSERSERLAILVSGLRLHEARAQALADAFLLEAAYFSREPLAGMASQPLQGLDGPVAYLSWPAPRPGTTSLPAVAVPIGIALLLVTAALLGGARTVCSMGGSLERALVAAQAADRAKAEFLATLSHELRTPMNGIVGMLDLMRTTELTPEQAEYVEVALASSETQLELIEHLLAFGRIDAGTMELTLAPFAPAELIREVVALLGPSAREKGLDLTLTLDGLQEQILLGDRLAIRQVAVNLIGNAIKFTPAGRVDVRLGVFPGLAATLVRLRVADTGPGVPVQDRARIFEPFVQGDGSITRAAGGVGLGLAIARRLAQRMGGTLSLQDNPDGGALFVFDVRLDAPVAAQQEGARAA